MVSANRQYLVTFCPVPAIKAKSRPRLPVNNNNNNNNNNNKTTTTTVPKSLTFPSGLHSRSRVDSVPKQAVPGHLLPHHASDTGPRVDPNPQLEGVLGPVRNNEPADGLQQVEGHGGDLTGVLNAVGLGQSADHHVSVADRLHLVHVVELDCGVEQRI